MNPPVSEQQYSAQHSLQQDMGRMANGAQPRDPSKDQNELNTHMGVFQPNTSAPTQQQLTNRMSGLSVGHNYDQSPNKAPIMSETNQYYSQVQHRQTPVSQQLPYMPPQLNAGNHPTDQSNSKISQQSNDVGHAYTVNGSLGKVSAMYQSNRVVQQGSEQQFGQSHETGLKSMQSNLVQQGPRDTNSSPALSTHSNQPPQMSQTPSQSGQWPQAYIPPQQSSAKNNLHQGAVQNQKSSHIEGQITDQITSMSGQVERPGQQMRPHGMSPQASPREMGQPPMHGQFSSAHSQMSPVEGQIPPTLRQMPPMQGQMPSMQGQMPPSQGQMPPSQGQMPPSQGQMPPSQGQLPPMQKPSMQGQMRSMQSHMPPMQGQIPSMQGQMPPIQGQMPQIQGQMPPMQGQMPPMQGHMPPMQGQMPPMQGQMPPMQGQMPPMQGHMPPMQGHMPPMQGQMPPMHGQMPPMQGQMPPMQGQMSQIQGQMPPMQGQMPPMQGQMPPMQGQMPPMPRSLPHMQGQMPPVPSQMSGQMPPMPGQMPPMPGNLANMSGQPGGQAAMGGSYPVQGGPMAYQQSQQPRRLDPDQMPSPIQVTSDDQKNRSGIFATNQKGLVPPLVTTQFITQDQGNAGPRFIRSSMYNVPVTIDMMKQTAVPFGLVISPLARTLDNELVPPIVNLGEIGPVRCVRCKAYMCPFMQFIDSGRRFQCLFCKASTEVPAEYFQHLDHTGQRLDRFERPELILGTYEFVATKDYCRNNVFPKPPAVIFVIDVSYNNIKSGLIPLLCSNMKEIIRNLPKDHGQSKSNMQVGFITYDKSVHFYNVKASLAQPQMLVVGDIQEMFMPLLDGFLCDPEESEIVIDSLMEQIPAMFSETSETEILLAPAIQAGLEALKASECSGKLLVFHSSLPIAEAPGKLKNRDDRTLLGTDKEKSILTPQCNTYNNLGQECVAVGCSVDLFLFNNSYIDLATIGQVSRLTGGEIYKYTYFQSYLDGPRVIQDIITNISRPVAFDSIMRVRTSTGVRPTDFYGHFFMSNTTDMELASIDCDKAVAIEIKHDDKLTEEDGVYIQVALLYTSCGGQRRLRIHNLSLKTCSQMADLYRSCDLDTIVNFFSKQAMVKMLESSPQAYKDALVSRCSQMLACYRKNCASPSSAGQLILPECMKLLPLYVNCILKSDAVSGGPGMNVDDRAFVMQAVLTMDIPSSVAFFYPRLIALHDLNPDEDDLPQPIRCTVSKLLANGVYLLENGIHMFLWIGLRVPDEWLQEVFGVSALGSVRAEEGILPELDTPMSVRFRGVLQKVQSQRHRCMRITIVKQGGKMSHLFNDFLVEDRGSNGSASYVDFLCHMHKEIRLLLS